MADINALAAQDLGSIWRSLRDGADPAEALHDILPAIVDKYGAAAASWAADWYDDLRDSLGIGGSFSAIPAEPGDTGAHALIGWALDEATDDGSLIALLEGGLQRRVVNFGRFTIMSSSVGDKYAGGWQRLGQGKNCDFCDVLISRGNVYSEDTADFGAHDHCNCVAVPAFKGEPKPVKPYTPSTRWSSDPKVAARQRKANREAVSAWISQAEGGD